LSTLVSFGDPIFSCSFNQLLWSTSIEVIELFKATFYYWQILKIENIKNDNQMSM